MGTSKILIDGAGIDLTQDTVAANKMLSGIKAHDSGGNSVTGTIQSKAAQTYTPGTTDQTIAAGQFLSGAQTVKGDANLTAGNIKSGVSIFGVAGSLTPGITPSGTKQITANGTYDVTEFASAVVNVRDEHYIRVEFTVSSRQTAPIVAITDPMIAAHYTDDTALARYKCITGQDGRYEGLQTNTTVRHESTVYGFYRTNAPGQLDSLSTTPMYSTTTSSKAMFADANGNLKINATSANYLSAGTYTVDFWW